MIDDIKKARMLNLFKDGWNPYRIAKFLKLALGTVIYNMNKWIGEGMLIRINPGSTPIVCEPGVNFFRDNNQNDKDFAISISNYDLLNRLHYLEGMFNLHLTEIRSEIKEAIENVNCSLIENKIFIDKKSLNFIKDYGKLQKLEQKHSVNLH